jgi:Transglycosylase SLT domain
VENKPSILLLVVLVVIGFSVSAVGGYHGVRKVVSASEPQVTTPEPPPVVEVLVEEQTTEVSSQELVLADTTEISVTVTPTPIPDVTTTPDTISSTPTPTVKLSPTPTLTVTPTEAPSITQTIAPSPTIAAIIAPVHLEPIFTKYAGLYGADINLMKKIAKCESSFNNNAVGGGGAYVGMFQFSESSWITQRNQMGKDANPGLRFGAEESIETAAFALSKGKVFMWKGCAK